MKQFFILCTAAITLLTPSCRDNIDESIRRGDFGAAYYYHSGGRPADRFVIITVVVNKNGGILKREEHSIRDTRKNKETLAQFPVSSTDLKKLHGIVKQKGFYEIKTEPIDDPGARTLYLKIKAGEKQYIREESPVVSMASTADRQKFMAIIGEFNDFVKERLPAEQKRLVDY